MRRTLRSLSFVGLLFAGYVVGWLQMGSPLRLSADSTTSEALPGPIRDKVREANRTVAEAMQMLQDEKRYVPAIQGLNAFATSVGGVDAIADLESGQGVDPETFAGLYAGQGLAEISEHLRRDGEGHVTYKNKIVRLYSPVRLKQLFASRGDVAPGNAGPKRSAAPKKDVEKKDAEPAEKKDE